MKNKIFVFVVCGDDEHIDTLHYSLLFLQRFSSFPIYVVTDSIRNSKKIDFDTIIDIKTPSHYNNHQASIYLKTGLHRWLDMTDDTLYCYLDSDVIALNEGVDTIFEQYRSPITFAPDHCPMPEFSGEAVYPPTEELKTQQQALLQAIQEVKAHCPIYVSEDEDWQIQCHQRARCLQINPIGGIFFWLLKALILSELMIKLSKVPSPQRWAFQLVHWPLLPLLKLLRAIVQQRFVCEEGFWKDIEGHSPLVGNWNFLSAALAEDRVYNPFNRYWYNAQNGQLIGESFVIDYVQKHSEFKRNALNKSWQNAQGQTVFSEKNDWLSQAIKQTFGIDVTDKNWQHWNGGVFLFDKDSIVFLENWHLFTLQIFENPFWKTRDQGTLIATIWKYGLQNHKMLSRNFNFIADYFSNRMRYNGNLEFNLNNETFKPSLIHVFHHFGDANWVVWKDIVKMETP